MESTQTAGTFGAVQENGYGAAHGEETLRAEEAVAQAGGTSSQGTPPLGGQRPLAGDAAEPDPPRPDRVSSQQVPPADKSAAAAEENQRGPVPGEAGQGGLALGLTPQELGKLGEDIACLYLGQRGYEVLARNWRCFGGEADVVAALDGTVVLAEVKTRRGAGDPAGAVYPEEAVDERKRVRYRRIAQCYLAEHPEVRSIRFDVIAILVVDGSHAHVHHVCGAFGWDERP